MSATGSRLSALTRELCARWAQTRESWLDAKADEFDRRFMEDLRQSVETGVTVIEKMDALLAKMRKDCE